jgi:hypothetical protein
VGGCITAEAMGGSGITTDPGLAAVTVVAAASTTAVATIPYSSCKQANMSRSTSGNHEAVSAGTANGVAHIKAVVKSSPPTGRAHESHVHDGQSDNLSVTREPCVAVVANTPDDKDRGKAGQPSRSISRGNISDSDQGDTRSQGPPNDDAVAAVSDGAVVCVGVGTEFVADEDVGNVGATVAVACVRGIKTCTSAGNGA